MKADRTRESILVITVGFIILYLIYHNVWLLYVALGCGSIGVLVKPVASLIAKAWLKLGDILGFIVSKVVLVLLFYILLTPISLLYRLFNKDVLSLKRQQSTLWHTRDLSYSSKDLKNSW